MSRWSAEKPGDKVVIVEDCRDVPSKADGQVAVYEGDFPRSVILMRDIPGKEPEVLGECTYEQYQDDNFTIMNKSTNEEFVVHDLFAEWNDGIPKPKGRLIAMVSNNPRMRLADGSVIWGDECWWSAKRAEEGNPTLEQRKESLSIHKDVLARAMRALTQEKERITRSRK